MSFLASVFVLRNHSLLCTDKTAGTVVYPNSTETVVSFEAVSGFSIGSVLLRMLLWKRTVVRSEIC